MQGDFFYDLNIEDLSWHNKGLLSSMYTRSERGCNVCGVVHDHSKKWFLEVYSLVWVELGGSNHLTLNAKWSPVQGTARRKGTSVVSIETT